MLTVTQLELFRKAKNGTAAFLLLSLSYPPLSFLCVKNDTSLSLCIWITCLVPAWEPRGRVGSCGGLIWYELKVFPNRLHGV